MIYLGAPLNYQANLPNSASFNTSAFNIVSSQQLSNNFRTFPTQFNNLRIDSMNNFNANLTKSFVIHENIKVQFRAESFNLTNRVVFGAPNLSGDQLHLRLHHDGYQLAARYPIGVAPDVLISVSPRHFTVYNREMPGFRR